MHTQRQIPSHIIPVLKRSRSFIFMAVVLALSGLSSLCAQEHTSVSIRATATVIDKSEIELVTIKDLELDEGMAVDGKIYIAAQRDAKAGIMQVKGRPDAQIRITYVPEMELGNSSGTGSLKFYYEVCGYPADNQRASEPLDAVERMVRFNDQGQYYLWVGGRIDISNAQPGSYEGEFILEIEYI